jgi:hypothetical protein
MSLYPSLHDRLKNQHEAIGRIIGSLDATRLNRQPLPGKWSIHDHIAHLAKYQPVFMGRIQAILQKEVPAFGRYKAENDPDFEIWRQFEIQDLLKLLDSDRHILFNLVNSLDDEHLGRAGLHPKFGKLTVIQWTEFFLLHEAHHMFTIFMLANDTETH